jgi:hypothetical protein
LRFLVVLRSAKLGKNINKDSVKKMKLQERINVFIRLGEELSAVLDGKPATGSGKQLVDVIPALIHSNGWYTEKNVRHRLKILAAGMTKEVMENWLKKYAIPENPPKTICVILAGNIPLVGFDDFRCVLISGNKFLGKIPSDDKRLLPLIAKMLIEIEPRFETEISFEESLLKGMDAVIATGSNNSSRYFDYYFSKYPHIIRKNRNGVAILTGKETKEELEKIGEDIFRYFGLGCRSVTKLFVPENYNFNLFFESIYNWGAEMLNNNKYMNNYDYHKALFLLAQVPLLDNNFLLLKEDERFSSPPGTVYYEKYVSENELKKTLEEKKELIQCVIGSSSVIPGIIPFGNSQLTGPGDYADGVDVMEFLIEKV